MLRPSGASAITSTCAPRRRKISGAARCVAPLAQSSRMRRPTEVEHREAGLQLAQVVLQRAVQLRDAARLGRSGSRLVEQRLDLLLDGVGQLVAVGAEELDAVVAPGVVRGRQHDAEVEAVAADQQRRGRRRQDAAEQRDAAGCGDPGCDSGFEHLARRARVADHEHARAIRRRCPAVRARVVAARPSASVSSAVRNSPATPRTPSVPNNRRATDGEASASRTAAACGPS